MATQLAFPVGSPEADVARLREQVRRDARNEPGTYAMHGAQGEVLYVGKSVQVRTRLLSYFRLAWPEHRQARLLRETARISWEPAPSEFAALLREVRLIRAHLPRYNVRSARPLDRWWVITIADGPAPRLRVQRASVAARQPGRGTVLGPFTARRPLAGALRVLNDALGLRDCPERTPMVLRDHGDLFEGDPQLARTPGCHRHETRRCLGPCVAACSAAEYRVQLARARAVLEGRDDAPRQALVREMAAASAALAFERAGWLRDRLAALEALEADLSRVRTSLRRPSLLYAVPGATGPDSTRVYLLQGGRVTGEAGWTDAAGLADLEQRAAATALAHCAVEPDDMDEVLMLDQWFRTRPAEMARTASTVAGLHVALGWEPVGYSSDTSRTSAWPSAM